MQNEKTNVTYQALYDPSAFLSTLTCPHILNSLYLRLSQLGSTELSPGENDLSISPSRSSRHYGLIVLTEPQGLRR